MISKIASVSFALAIASLTPAIEQTGEPHDDILTGAGDKGCSLSKLHTLSEMNRAKAVEV